MHNVTQLMLKSVHPEWLSYFNTISKYIPGKTIIEVLDDTITELVNLKVKPSPSTPDKVLRVLKMNPYDIKVLILGQDPYPEPNVATGLAFACNGEERPSLKIFKREIIKEYQLEELDLKNDLHYWEEQGVFLLNSSLSCEEFVPDSHSKIWYNFIRELMVIINDLIITNNQKIVFVFIGNQAKNFSQFINEEFHTKIFRCHPAAEIYGSSKFEGFFQQVNNNLTDEIYWF